MCAERLPGQERGPGNLARVVLVTFGAAGGATLRLVSDTVAGCPGQGPHAAAEVAARERPLKEILQEAQEHWTLQEPTPPRG